MGLVFVELVLSSRWCLLPGRQVVWVVCGGPGRGAKDADGRRRFTNSAAQPAHPEGERRRELAYHRTTRVQVTSIGLVGARSVIQAPRHIKVYGPCLPLSSMRVAFSFLVNECCGAVSREVELWLSDCELLIIVGSSAFPCSCLCPHPVIAFVFCIRA